jgi:serine/threonine protein kinase
MRSGTGAGTRRRGQGDVYSLGVLLFVLLANRLPYRADRTRAADLNPRDLRRGAGMAYLVRRGDLQSILGQALRKQPERRYLSVEQFAGDIRRYLAGLPVSALSRLVVYRLRKFVVRRAVPRRWCRADRHYCGNAVDAARITARRASLQTCAARASISSKSTIRSAC